MMGIQFCTPRAVVTPKEIQKKFAYFTSRLTDKIDFFLTVAVYPRNKS